MRLLFIFYCLCVQQLFSVSFEKVMLLFGVLCSRRQVLTVNICDSNVLGGNKAAEALDKYIKRLEKRKVKGRTKKQVYTLIKTAKVLQTALTQN